MKCRPEPGRKGNTARFPVDFCFQLSAEEMKETLAAGVIGADGRAALRSQIVTLKRGQHAKFPPFAFTEHGALMAANVLKSPRATAMSVYVSRAFVKQRQLIMAHADILKRLAGIDKTLLQHDQALQVIWKELEPLLSPPPAPPKRRIGFHP